MRYLFTTQWVSPLLVTLCFLTSSASYGFETPSAKDTNTGHSNGAATVKDIKKQKLSVSSQLSTQKIFPNLEPLITQLQRFSELKLLSQKLMPWIYLNSSESMMADFETTVTQLEIADANLQSAMYAAFVNNDLLGMSPKIKNAADQLDLAEFTLKLLLEIVDARL